MITKTTAKKYQEETLSNTQETKLPIWFWIIAAVALVWNLAGVGAFFAETMKSEEALAALPDAQRVLYETTPIWATAAFAVAVFGGFIGSIALMLRKSWSVSIFSASLAAIVAQMSYTILGANIVSVMGAGALIMPAVIAAIGIFLVWFSTFAKGRAWLA